MSDNITFKNDYSVKANNFIADNTIKFDANYNIHADSFIEHANNSIYFSKNTNSLYAKSFIEQDHDERTYKYLANPSDAAITSILDFSTVGSSISLRQKPGQVLFGRVYGNKNFDGVPIDRWIPLDISHSAMTSIPPNQFTNIYTENCQFILELDIPQKITIGIPILQSPSVEINKDSFIIYNPNCQLFSLHQMELVVLYWAYDDHSESYAESLPGSGVYLLTKQHVRDIYDEYISGKGDMGAISFFFYVNESVKSKSVEITTTDNMENWYIQQNLRS